MLTFKCVRCGRDLIKSKQNTWDNVFECPVCKIYTLILHNDMSRYALSRIDREQQTCIPEEGEREWSVWQQVIDLEGRHLLGYRNRYVVLPTLCYNSMELLIPSSLFDIEAAALTLHPTITTTERKFVATTLSTKALRYITFFNFEYSLEAPQEIIKPPKHWRI